MTVPPDAVTLRGDLGPAPLRVILLGTAAGPYPVAGRQGCASAVVVGDRVYLVDAGYGTVRKYAQSGLALRDLAAVFVTHLHSDHVVDLFPLFLLGWGPANAGVVAPVDVYGPGPEPGGAAGISGLVAGCLSGFGQDIAVRERTSARPPLAKLVRTHELAVPGGEVLVHEDDRVRVTARAVPHPPLHLALGFRFETEHGVVAFSGDTARSDAVGELAADADLLVHEAMEPGFYRELGYSGQLLDFLAASHTAPADVGRLATAAGARCVALSHVGPADPRHLSDEAWTRRVRPHYSGRIVVGHDLTQLAPRAVQGGPS
ncbi:MBL fold metallo-hydrolase [Amycolatopsis granulosa]|uniref:MBL fold metallo-hydrolase n=1 Tax=Amycolatopsis granulosa TaxID=185684 RepID=UPI00312C9009|nr:ribonuclease BN (tRNA processing enzyme) [Amycolatopsis granulosa]